MMPRTALRSPVQVQHHAIHAILDDAQHHLGLQARIVRNAATGLGQVPVGVEAQRLVPAVHHGMPLFQGSVRPPQLPSSLTSQMPSGQTVYSDPIETAPYGFQVAEDLQERPGRLVSDIMRGFRSAHGGDTARTRSFTSSYNSS